MCTRSARRSAYCSRSKCLSGLGHINSGKLRSHSMPQAVRLFLHRLLLPKWKCQYFLYRQLHELPPVILDYVRSPKDMSRILIGLEKMYKNGIHHPIAPSSLTTDMLAGYPPLI